MDSDAKFSVNNLMMKGIFRFFHSCALVLVRLTIQLLSTRLEEAAVVCCEAILGMLKCKADKATYSVEISLDHVV